MKQHQTIIKDEQLDAWMVEVCFMAHQAGKIISDHYHADLVLDVTKKKDGTPVTAADLESDCYIAQALSALTPNIPIVTEESIATIPFEQRQHWSTYWLVDPMDGTKEFVERTGEFSVNIALIHQHQPILGVVYGPEVGWLYAASKSSSDMSNAKKIEIPVTENASLESMKNLLTKALPIKTHSMNSETVVVKVAVSRRHGGKVDHFMQQVGEFETVKIGSALKACLVAEGKADLYPRFGPTSLWDTAASQMIVEAAGGAILNAAGHSLQYVQTPSLLNPFFIVVCDPNYPWPKFPEVF